MGGKNKFFVFALLFLFITVTLFSEDELMHRGTIPVELLRPRREESPRYPIDTVIGAMGQGSSPNEAYTIARNAAAALLAGDVDAPVLSSLNRTFLEDCLNLLDEINPRTYRLGGGREEPDGSVSFLVRFNGRDYGITGEIFIRLIQRRPVIIAADEDPEDEETGDESVQPGENGVIIAENSSSEQRENIEAESEEHAAETVPVPVVQAQPTIVHLERIWTFEDLILEEPRSREEENREIRHRFDFPPYERLF